MADPGFSQWRAKLGAGVLVTGMLTGCMSIPLATMWKMRSFGPGDLAAIEPANVRVATLLEPVVGGIDPAKSRLTLTLTPHDGADEVHAFGLALSPVQGGPIVPAGHPGWQVFQLDPDGAAKMRRIKPRLANLEEDYDRWALNVSIGGFDEMPRHVDALFFSVRLQLADDQDPLTLFDRARIEVERGG